MNMATFTFSEDEMYDLVYCAREATIRFKRARTEMRKGNDAYSHHTEEECQADIDKYSRIERTLKIKYEEAFGKAW
jgi:hypothetical protein